jgi:hypothetical protein
MPDTHWTVDQLRFVLSCQEQRYAAAMDCKDYELARRLMIQRDKTWDQLVRLIQAEDPHTTEADIRYFEYH